MSYDEFGWNLDDTEDIINSITGTEFGENNLTRSGSAYNSAGYDIDGYDSSGYNSSGYNSSGFNSSGYHSNGTPYDSAGYDMNGYNSDGYNSDGYNSSGFNSDGYNSSGYNSSGYDVNGWNSETSILINSLTGTEFGLNSIYTRSGSQYNSAGWNVDGYDINGYDINGWNAAGINQTTQDVYDTNGFNINGWNVDGIHQSTGAIYNSSGIDVNGNNVTPEIVTNVSATIQNATDVLVEWSASATGGNGLVYRIYDENDQTVSGDISDTSVTITYNNPLGNTYKYRIASIISSTGNISDYSLWSNDVTFPKVLTPSIISYSYTNDSVTLSFSAAAGDTTTTAFYIVDMSNTYSDTTTDSSYTFYGLPTATYTFYVFAENADGERSNSASCDNINLTPPDVPTSLNYTIGNSSITLTWEPPASSEINSQVNGYYIIDSVNARENTSSVTPGDTGLSVTLESILSATEYNLVIYSKISDGIRNLQSEPAYFGTINTQNTPWKPAKPVITSESLGNVNITWDPNAFEGNPITKYIVTIYSGYSEGYLGVALPPYDVETEGPIPSLSTTVTPGYSYYCTITAVANDLSSEPSDQSDYIIAPAIPGPPTNISASLAENQTNVYEITWTPPEFTGYLDSLNYNIYDQSGNIIEEMPVPIEEVSYSALINIAKQSEPITAIYITAENAVGESVPSETYSFDTPLLPQTPSAPRNITVIPLSGSATVSWSPPNSDGGSAITGYKIISVPDNKAPQTVGADILSVTMTGLKNGTSYRFRVFAENEHGLSGQTLPITPYALPGNPKITSTVGNNIITLSWTATPGAVASPIIDYRVTREDDPTFELIIEAQEGVNGGSCEITTGFTIGTSIVFRVRSRSSIGVSAIATPITVIPLSLPDTPPTFNVAINGTTANLTWTAPYNGGTSLTGYTITYKGITRNLAANILRLSVTAITVNEGVRFSLVAKNKIGSSNSISYDIYGGEVLIAATA